MKYEKIVVEDKYEKMVVGACSWANNSPQSTGIQ